MNKKKKTEEKIDKAALNKAEKAEETEAVKEADPIEKELADTKEQLLRVTAEYANFRKRSEKEKQDSFNFAKADTIKELLPIIDNLERAIASEQEDFDGLKKGVEMIYDSLMNALSKMSIDVYGKSGEVFDPALHNAVMHIEDESLSDGEIVDVFQKGYKLGDKIIRAAMVKTAN